MVNIIPKQQHISIVFVSMLTCWRQFKVLLCVIAATAVIEPLAWLQTLNTVKVFYLVLLIHLVSSLTFSCDAFGFENAAFHDAN